MKPNRHPEENAMTRLMMAVLLVGACALPARAEHGATVEARYTDLDTRGHRGQVQEYDGKLYYVGHGDVEVSNQGAEGLFDFSLLDIGSREEIGNLEVDFQSGWRASAKYQNMHHRLNFMRTGQVQNGTWLPKTAITQRDPEDEELMIRRSETELNFAFVSPDNAARFLSAQYWNVDKVGSRSWMWTGSPNIQRGRVSVDNTKQDFTFACGTDMKENGAMSVDLIRSEFEDNAPKLASLVDGGTGSSNNGGVIKRPDGRQSMTGAEFKFRHDLGKDLALTGAFTGRQRENLHTGYKFNSVVGALNAAYRASDKLSLLGRLYLRAFEIDENQGYTPALDRSGAVAAKQTHQLDKTTIRGELTARLHPVERLRLKAAYKLEVNNRRDAPTQVYSGNRYFADGYFVPVPWDNYTAHNDTRHLFTLGATAELPLGAELEVDYKKLYANRAAFVTQANRQDDANATLTVPLPKEVSFTLAGGFQRERNSDAGYSHYSQSRNTYRAGLDWAATSKTFLGADVSYEAVRTFTELYLGSGSATPSLTTGYHGSVCNRQNNTVFGAHGRVNLPKGFVALGHGSYTRSTIATPTDYQFLSGKINDFTPSNVNIARGGLSVEYTPEKYKHLTARAGYSVSDWVDKYDELNSGRASIAQLGVSAKF